MSDLPSLDEVRHEVQTAYNDLREAANAITFGQAGDWWDSHSPARQSIQRARHHSPLVQLGTPITPDRGWGGRAIGQGTLTTPVLLPRQSGAFTQPTMPGYRRRRFGRRRFRGRRRRTFRRRYRRYGRKKSSWGTRVRRAAAKLGESKRLITVQPVTSIQPNTVYNMASFDLTNPKYVSTTGDFNSIQANKTRRTGRYITATGLAVQFHAKNLQASTATFMRVLIGYKKIERADTQNSSHTSDDKKLFKTRETEKNCSLSEFHVEKAEPNYMAIHAHVDRKYFKKFFDKTWRLEGVDNDAGNHINTKWYIPLRNRPQKFEAESDLVNPTVSTTDWMLTMHIYVADAEMNVVTTTNLASYSFTATYYFRDIN